MSVASPQNRDELKQYIKTKLGAPVLQINVSDEQMDLAINDAFQYFYERQHFDATEQVYLSMKIEPAFKSWMKTAELQSVTQATTQPRSAEGMVDTLTLVTPGSGYAPSSELMGAETTGGTGTGLKVTLGDSRTTTGGLTSAAVYVTGSGYLVGDPIAIPGDASRKHGGINSPSEQPALPGGRVGRRCETKPPKTRKAPVCHDLCLDMYMCIFVYLYICTCVHQ